MPRHPPQHAQMIDTCLSITHPSPPTIALGAQ